MDDRDAPAQQCAGCHEPIERCEFCENDDCSKATCFSCLIIDIGEEQAQPHDHGG